MKIKKLFLIKSIIIIVLILSLSTIFASDNKSVNSTVYSNNSYGTDYAKYYSDLLESTEWKQIFKTRTERVEAAQIPEEILKKMSTDELIKAVIKYPLICELYAYNEFRTGFKQVYDSYNGIRELLDRDDVADKLIDFYNSINNLEYASESKNGINIMNLQIILAQPEFTDKLNTQQIEKLLKSTRTVYRNGNHNFFDICLNELISINIPNLDQSIQIVFGDENGNREGISFFSNSYDFNDTLSDDTKNGTFIPRYKYIKAFFENSSDADVTIFLQNSYGDTLSGGTFTAKAGKNGLSSIIAVAANGTYRFNVNSDGGTTNINGKLVIKSATTKDELK